MSAAKKLQHQAIVKSLAEVFSLERDVKGFHVIDNNNPNLLMITKITIKSYLQLFSLKNYSVKALFTLILSIKKIITLN